MRENVINGKSPRASSSLKGVGEIAMGERRRKATLTFCRHQLEFTVIAVLLIIINVTLAWWVVDGTAN